MTRLAALGHAVGVGGASLELPSSGLEGTPEPRRGLEFWTVSEDHLFGASAISALVDMRLIATAGGGFTEHCRHEGIASEHQLQVPHRVHRVCGLDEIRM